MAYVKAMNNKDGVVTSHRVPWRRGSARVGDWQSELFPGAGGADNFCEDVNATGERRSSG